MRASFTIGAFWFVTNDDHHILLQKRADLEVRGLPGWAMEWHETPREAAVREVKEETGFDVKMERLVGIYSKPLEKDVWIGFACSIQWGTMCISEESIDIGFFDPKKLPDNMQKRHKERIDDFFSSQEVILKKQI